MSRGGTRHSVADKILRSRRAAWRPRRPLFAVCRGGTVGAERIAMRRTVGHDTVGVGGNAVGAFHTVGVFVVHAGARFAVGFYSTQWQRQHTKNDYRKEKSSHRSFPTSRESLADMQAFAPKATLQFNQRKASRSLPEAEVRQDEANDDD